MRRRGWLALALAFVAASGCTDSAAGPPGMRVGGPAPQVEGTDLDGQPLRLSDLRGRVVLVNFWATWCDPCVEEIPDLAKVAQHFAAQGVQVMGANVDADNPRRLADFAQRHHMTYPVVATTPQTVEAYRLAVIPTTFLVDQRGVIRKRYLGPRDYDTFARDLNDVLQATTAAGQQGGA